MTHHQIIFHPFRENILDYIGAKNLTTIEKEPVYIRRAAHTNFIIEINGKEVFRHDDNLTVSKILNDFQVGVTLSE